MICDVCLRGATYNGQWREAIKREPVPHNASTILALANEAHSLCSGCNCQHATGEESLAVLPL